jgi:hypothetical protein
VTVEMLPADREKIAVRLKIRLERAARAQIPALAGLALLCVTAGCSQTMPDREIRMTRSYIYYLDGAGGGRPLSNWSGGVRQGLLDAGYNGAGEMFAWNTGLGVVADQDSSVEYKKQKASELAQQIQKYTQEHPRAPVTLMGLSAGTAVTVFTLEALPVNCPVNNVILLGASVSATYDLTQALQRVSNRMYVFTSQKDAVLAFLVPTAARCSFGRTPGLHDAGRRVGPDAGPVRQGVVHRLAAGVRAGRELRRPHGYRQGTVRAGVHRPADHAGGGAECPTRGHGGRGQGAEPGLWALGGICPRILGHV